MPTCPIGSDDVQCGRFTLTRQNRRELAQLLGVDEDDLRDYKPRYNIAPTDQHFIVTSKYERRTARTASWGLVNSWATANSRASQEEEGVIPTS